MADRETDRRMDGWIIDRWMDGWMDVWMGGWMEGDNRKIAKQILKTVTSGSDIRLVCFCDLNLRPESDTKVCRSKIVICYEFNNVLFSH